jgi:hypothetical protein
MKQFGSARITAFGDRAEESNQTQFGFLLGIVHQLGKGTGVRLQKVVIGDPHA